MLIALKLHTNRGPTPQICPNMHNMHMTKHMKATSTNGLSMAVRYRYCFCCLDLRGQDTKALKQSSNLLRVRKRSVVPPGGRVLDKSGIHFRNARHHFFYREGQIAVTPLTLVRSSSRHLLSKARK